MPTDGIYAGPATLRLIAIAIGRNILVVAKNNIMWLPKDMGFVFKRGVPKAFQGEAAAAAA